MPMNGWLVKRNIMEGWIMLHRQITENDLWSCEPFSKAQAWIDLLLLAHHKPGSITVRGILVPLARGQVGYSELTLSDRWKWSRNKTRLFLDSLRKRQMVDIDKNNKTTIITILNYDIYQSSETAKGTPKGTPKGTAEGHQKDTINNGDNGETEKKEEYCTHKKRKLTGKRLETFNLFWAAFDYPRGKAEAADAWIDIPELTDSLVGKIVEAAKIEASGRSELIRQGHTPKMAQGWINGKRWEDEKYSPVRSTGYTDAEIYAMRAIN